MWKNFFKVALRNIAKNRVFTVINISGLAIGMASAVLIILFIMNELSFDRFNENRDRIYRLYIDGDIGDQSFRGAWTSMVMAPTFTSEIPEIENFARFDIWNQQLIWYDEHKYVEDNFMFADSTLFDIFTVNFKRGDPETALVEPRSIVITEEKAKLYFGDRDPIGLPLSINKDSNYYVVTGVIEPFPENSHFFADFIASMVTVEDQSNDIWFQNSIFSYVLLKPGADYREVEEKMSQVMLRHITPQLESILGVTPQEWVEGGNKYGVFLQPLKDIHLNPDIDVGVEICYRPVNDRRYIYIFGVIAFFILVIASINFMNLATARSVLRAREIGLRKVVGSGRSLLIKQFLTESILLSLISLAIALFLVEISLPWFNNTMNLNLSFNSVGTWYMLLTLLVLSVFMGFLSGTYPAFFLARYRPIEGIKGELIGGKNSRMFRSMMVVVQFSISVAIIVGTMIVFSQLRYMLDKDLGFDKKHLVVMKRIYPLGNRIQTFCRELEKIPGVEKATNSTTYLGFNNSTETYRIKGRDASKNFLFATNYVDGSFLETYNFRLADDYSRFFSSDFPTDSNAILINRAAVREYGIEDPLNTIILEPDIKGDTTELRIIGVVEDFHHSTLKEPVGPYMLRFKSRDFSWSGYITIRLGVVGQGVNPTLNKIEKLWLQMTNDEPFQYFFLDDEIDKFYKEEKRTGRLSLMFAILATLIAMLGLFGLTLYNTQRKTREIGIRKAMGASIREVIIIVAREILLLMTISIFLAWLAAYFFMQEIWLRDFPFNIGFKPWIYIISAVSAMFVALLTVSWLAWSAARSNPSEILHYE